MWLATDWRLLGWWMAKHLQDLPQCHHWTLEVIFFFHLNTCRLHTYFSVYSIIGKLPSTTYDYFLFLLFWAPFRITSHKKIESSCSSVSVIFSLVFFFLLNDILLWDSGDISPSHWSFSFLQRHVYSSLPWKSTLIMCNYNYQISQRLQVIIFRRMFILWVFKMLLTFSYYEVTF